MEEHTGPMRDETLTTNRKESDIEIRPAGEEEDSDYRRVIFFKGRGHPFRVRLPPFDFRESL